MNPPPSHPGRRRMLLTAGAIAATGAAACASPVTLLNAVTPEPAHGRVVGLPYVPGSQDPRHRLDVYRPDGPPGDSRPVVVFFYGGSWRSGDREEYRFVGEALAAAGIVAVIPDYRLYPAVSYPSFLEDGARAVAWAWQHAADFGGDARRLVLMGHSAGAYNAAMLALDPRWLATEGVPRGSLAAWIGLAGPYDFLPVTVPEVMPVFHHPHESVDSQPVAHVHDRTTPLPTFLGVSRKDDYVDPQRNSVHLAAQLRAASAPVEMRWYEHTTHATLIGAFARPLRWIDPVRQDVVDFVRRSTADRGAPDWGA